MAGQIDMAINDPIAALPQVRAGLIKAYGITTKTRLLSAPDIPTLDEAGRTELRRPRGTRMRCCRSRLAEFVRQTPSRRFPARLEKQDKTENQQAVPMG